MTWLAKVREYVRGVVFRERVNAETEEELEFHLAMEAEHRARTLGLAPAAARRAAQLAFGGVDRHAEGVRDARGFGALNGVSLDVKLGGRMLRKYPGLTLAGGLTLAIAVALAASFFEFVRDMSDPQITLPDAHEVVTIRNIDRASGDAAPRSLHDFETWREEMTSLRDLAAIVNGDFSILTQDGALATVRGAEMSASAFRVAGTGPVLGRTFTAADEEPGAELPAVIGYRVWQEQFGGRLDVIGRTLEVGGRHATVVGVMPEGYGFPVNHELWLPLRERASAYERGSGPAIMPIARLTRGTSVGEAQAELDVIAQRLAGQYPQTNEHIRPQVRRIADAIGMTRLVHLINVPFFLFLVVVCANIATLVFARTAARSSELAVRSALGASRRRLVLQLVAEALVLTGSATALGLVLASYGLQYGMALFWEVQQSAPPFWFDEKLAPLTITYALLLSVIAATIIGGIPALKATGPQLRPRLAEGGAGAAGLRFGRVSTAVIVLQVALCVIFLPIAVSNGRALLPDRDAEVLFPAQDFLTGRLVFQADAGLRMDGGVGDSGAIAKQRALLAEAKRRLGAQPGVIRAALVSRMPGFNHPVSEFTFESDSASVRTTRALGVDPDFFALVRARIIAGRDFSPAEHESGARVLLADAAWAAAAMPNRSPLGERVRLRERGPDGEEPIFEIIGVVDGVDPAIGPGERVGLFQPLNTGRFTSVQAYLRTAQPPITLVPDVHGAITGIDPALAVDQLQPLAEAWRPVLRANLFFIALLNVVAVIILGFALIGIYALMSFTVAQRTREIAIRAALGADPGSIIRSIFARGALQIGTGIVLGVVIVSVAILRTPSDAALVAGVAGLMMLVGLAGCFLPAARALRIHPTTALKAE